ncbi:MAG: hypothetical protein PVI82_08935 [Desulfobacterales bacterium]|jgi:hypothetical protein
MSIAKKLTSSSNVLVPTSQSFISMWGWRMTFIVTGCLVRIILVPANALFLRHKPQDLGQHPDGSLYFCNGRHCFVDLSRFLLACSAPKISRSQE